MCAQRVRLAILAAAVVIVQPVILQGQDSVGRSDWELGVGATVGTAGEPAFEGGSLAIGATVVLGHRVSERVVVRGGISLVGYDQLAELTAASSLPFTQWPPEWGVTQYWSLFVGPTYAVRLDASRISPYLGGRLVFMVERGYWDRKGLGIGGSTGARVRLTKAVGIESGLEAFFGRFHNRYRRSHGRTWEAGASVVLSTGIVLIL